MSNRPPVTSLSNLTDVSITSPTNQQGLLYNSGTTKWTNQSIPAGTLAGLTDVTIGTPADTQLLQYSSASSEWINYGPLNFTDLAGNIATTQMASGSGASATTYWRGDGTWASPPTGAVAFTTNLLMGDNAGNAISADGVNLVSPQFQYLKNGNFQTLFVVGNNDSTPGDTSTTAGLTLNTSGTSGQLVAMGPNLTSSGIVAANSLWLANTPGDIAITVPTGKSLKISTVSTLYTERMRFGSGIVVGSSSAADSGTGTVNVTSGYYVNGNRQSIIMSNASTSGVSPTNTDVYLAGSSIVIGAGNWAAGGQYKCRFEIVKTAASTAVWTLNIRVGTAGTTADTLIIGGNMFTQTAAVDTMIVDINVNIRTIGASATSAGNILLSHTAANNAGYGLPTQVAPLATAQVATFNSTTATTIGVSFNGGTSHSGNVSTVQASYMQ